MTRIFYSIPPRVWRFVENRCGRLRNIFIPLLEKNQWEKMFAHGSWMRHIGAAVGFMPPPQFPRIVSLRQPEENQFPSVLAARTFSCGNILGSPNFAGSSHLLMSSFCFPWINAQYIIVHDNSMIIYLEKYICISKYGYGEIKVWHSREICTSYKHFIQ